MRRLLFPILVMLCFYISGCSIPMAAKYSQLNTFSSNGTAKKKKFSFSESERPVEDFLGNKMYKEDIDIVKGRVEKYISVHSNLSEATKNNLGKLRVSVGATKEEVELLLGKPTKIIKRKDNAHAISEIWLYKTNKRNPFAIVIIPIFVIHEEYCLYFKENVLSDIQRHYLKQIVETINP